MRRNEAVGLSGTMSALSSQIQKEQPQPRNHSPILSEDNQILETALKETNKKRPERQKVQAGLFSEDPHIHDLPHSPPRKRRGRPPKKQEGGMENGLESSLDVAEDTPSRIFEALQKGRCARHEAPLFCPRR